MPQQRPSTAPQNLKIAIEPQLWVCVCVKLTSVSSLLHWMTSQQHLFPLLSFFLLLYDSLPHWNSLLGELQSFSDLLKMYLQMEWWTDKLGGLDSASSSKLSSCRFFFFFKHFILKVLVSPSEEYTWHQGPWGSLASGAVCIRGLLFMSRAQSDVQIDAPGLGCLS